MPLYQVNGRNLLFIHVPKTGGKSVEEFLKEVSGGQALFYPRKQDIFPSSPQHMHAEALELLFGDGFIDHSFMVVRNPYRRFVSEYHWRVTRRNGAESFKDWAASALDTLERNSYVLDNHLRPQIEFRMNKTTVHRLEQGLEKAVHAALAAVGLDIDAPSLRQTHKVATVEVAAPQALAHRLREIYAADFEAFEYDPDDLAGAFSIA